MKYIKKYRRLIIFLLVFSVFDFFVLPRVQVGYSEQDQRHLNSYATRVTWILLSVAWAGLIIYFIISEGFASVGKAMIALAFTLASCFFVLRPVVQVAIFLLNSSVTGEPSEVIFRAVFPPSKDNEVYLGNTDSAAPSILLRYPANRQKAADDTIVLVKRSGLFGVNKYSNQ